MGNIIKDLLRRDECQPLTEQQEADIIAQTATRPKANVYIKPYEIMDLDGSEQVVGEVQKTIDGVKKKKPLYEKIITGTKTSAGNYPVSVPQNIDDMIRMYGTMKVANGDVVSFGYYNGDASDMCQAYYHPSDNIIGIIGFGGTYKIILEYTKTSDSWEVV